MPASMPRPLLLVGAALAGLAGVVHADAPSSNKLGNLNEKDVLQELHRESAVRREEIATGRHNPRLDKMRQTLRSMYGSLPKNAAGKLGRQVVRYALHRFFVQQNGWFIRGLEPTRSTDHADLEHHKSDQLREWVPIYLQDAFEQETHHEGADLDELVILTAALEDIIHLEARQRLTKAFSIKQVAESATLNDTQAEDLLFDYYIEFLRTNDLEFRRLAGEQPTTADLSAKDEWVSAYPHWKRDQKWLREKLAAERLSVGGPHNAQTMFKIVENIGETFHTFNDGECESLKQTLQGMEGARIGRVPLHTFYGSSQSGWKFTERKEYLRSLGLLEETDEKRQYVISTNYVMSRHNCFAPSDVYVICCRSECEGLLGRLETEIGAPTASVSQLAALVSKFETKTVPARAQLPVELMSRLSQVAEVNGGVVPLHGRLFAQWMHHAFPQECAFPHKSTEANPHSANEWMNQSVDMSEEELTAHMADDGCRVDASGKTDCGEDVPLPWYNEEELLSKDHILSTVAAGSTRWSRTQGRFVKAGVASALMVGLWLLALQREGKSAEKEWKRMVAARQPLVPFAFFAFFVYVIGLLNDGLLLCILAFFCVGGLASSKLSGPCDAKICSVSEDECHKFV